MGTANAALEPAMSGQQARDALAKGCALAMAEIDAGADIIALGEMGIGNTASSALLVHRLTPAPLDDCIGVGAGQDDADGRKRAAIARAAARSNARLRLTSSAEFGGLEIAMMAGAVLGAASRRRPVVIDGFISTAAALVAIRLCPAARDYCVFAHRSAERGHDIGSRRSTPSRCSISGCGSAKAPVPSSRYRWCAPPRGYSPTSPTSATCSPGRSDTPLPLWTGAFALARHSRSGYGAGLGAGR